MKKHQRPLEKLGVHRKTASHDFMLCIKNKGFPSSLELRKVYRAIPDAQAASHRMVRIIDESGEDYLYPETFFVSVDLPAAAKRAFAKAS